MKLSIIIVNYNVKYFLQQCLYSVKKAIKNTEAEIIVADNNSVDSSCSMIRSEFPEVILINNKENIGFSKANNQAIKISKGQYVLLLNPDTVVQEDTFEKCIHFMDNHQEAGALGVKMIDGKGNFLPESKRALPTPEVAFYKISGLSFLFPKSKIFGRYHLGYLNKNKINEVDILSGAYMFIRKSALEKTGNLDEAFFMYGEDVDLSYRLLKAGFKNYYFPETTIIHYKGESTRKGSINYVMIFYNAMIIFVKKHFNRQNATLFSTMIHLAIYLRAFLSIIKRIIKNLLLPLFDAIVIYEGFNIIKPIWENFKFSGSGIYPKAFLNVIVPSYIFCWILSLFISGVYDKPFKLYKLFRGILTGTLVILAIYALLPMELRYSRALILIGMLWSLLSLSMIRVVLHFIWFKNFRLGEIRKKIAIVGKEIENQRVTQLLRQSHIKTELIGFISSDEKTDQNYLGNINQIQDIIRIHRIDEIIFCAKDIPAQAIIGNMLKLSDTNLEYKIAPPESLSIIGSSSINTSGDFYFINLNAINKESNQRIKRFIDIAISLLLLILYPFLLIIIFNRLKALRNIILVLLGFKTWVSYFSHPTVNTEELPKIKTGVLSPLDGLSKEVDSNDIKEKMNLLYAKDYKVVNDLFIIFKGVRYIGR